MSWFHNLRIGVRLSVLLVIMILLIVGVVSFGQHGMARISAGLKTIYEDRTVCLVQLSSIQRDWYRIQNNLLLLTETEDGNAASALLDGIGRYERDINATWADYTATYLTPEEKQIVDRISVAVQQYKAIKDTILSQMAAGQTMTADKLARDQGRESFAVLDAALSDNIRLQEQVAKQEYQTGLQTFETVSRMNLGIAALGLLIALIVTWLIIRELVQAISDMVHAMSRLANGDTDTQVAGRTRRDELGAMAKAVDVFKLNAIERNKLEEQEKVALARREARQQTMDRLTAEFDQAVCLLLDRTTLAAKRMNTTAEEMLSNADFTQKQAAAVSAATEQASANVSTIASASNEMLASIQEIGHQVSRSASIASNAAVEAEQTNQKIEGLANSASRIGEVVELISVIARQTNLLALNANIEAARAGDAGKGFAVVANEVKSLATKTAHATQEITQQISAIQSETQGAVDAIRRITTVVNEINEMSAAIAGAVEEQGAAMQEVVRNVEEAASGTREVACSITHVVQAARSTSNMVGDVRTAAQSLEQESNVLKGSVDGFLTGVKAA